jgi:hypothetical protein
MCDSFLLATFMPNMINICLVIMEISTETHVDHHVKCPSLSSDANKNIDKF